MLLAGYAYVTACAVSAKTTVTPWCKNSMRIQVSHEGAATETDEHLARRAHLYVTYPPLHHCISTFYTTCPFLWVRVSPKVCSSIRMPYTTAMAFQLMR